MSVYFFVHEADGRILRSGICRDVDVEAQAAEAGETGVESVAPVSPHYSYVVDGALADRPATSVSGTLTDRTITLAGVPMGCEVNVAGAAYINITMDDPSGLLAIIVPLPGMYIVSCDPWPTLEYSQSFTVL